MSNTSPKMPSVEFVSHWLEHGFHNMQYFACRKWGVFTLKHYNVTCHDVQVFQGLNKHPVFQLQLNFFIKGGKHDGVQVPKWTNLSFKTHGEGEKQPIYGPAIFFRATSQ